MTTTREKLAWLILAHARDHSVVLAERILARFDLVPKGNVVVPEEDRGGLALALQSKNRHLEMSVARYYVDAVCDLLAARPGASHE